MNFIKQIIGFLSNKIISAESYYRINTYYKKIGGYGYRLGGEVRITHPENISIGEGTYINGGELCASTEARISIGCDCLISYGFFARTDVHNYMSKDILIKYQGNSQFDIFIGDDVWIAADVKVLAGVCIADGCVICAGAIVTKDTEPYGVYAGIPAKKIKYRV